MELDYETIMKLLQKNLKKIFEEFNEGKLDEHHWDLFNNLVDNYEEKDRMWIMLDDKMIKYIKELK